MEMSTVKLGDIADFSNGVNFDKSAYRKGIKLIGVADFKDYTTPVIPSLNEVYSHVVRPNDLLKADDIVFVRSNGNKDLVGRCMIIPRGSESLTYSGFCIRCRFKDKSKYYPKYFLYLFKSPKFRKLLSNTSVGANIQNLSQGRLNRTEVEIPSYEIQCKIASILSSYDDMIANCKKQIALLEEAAQRLYREWFATETSTNGILSDIAQDVGISTSKSDRDSFDCYTPIDCLSRKSLAYFSSKDISLAESSLKSYKPNDILFGAMRVYFHKVCIAQESGLTRSTCIVLNSIAPEFWSYLVLLMYSAETIAWAVTNSKESTNMPYITWERLKVMPIHIPNLELVTKFNKLVAPYLEQISVLAHTVRKLLSVKEELLPRLISGEIEINA